MMELSKLREILKKKYYPLDSKSSPLFYFPCSLKKSENWLRVSGKGI